MLFSKKRDINTGCGPIALMNILSYYRESYFEETDLLEFQESITEYLRGPVISANQFIRAAKKLFTEYEFKADFIKNTAFSKKSKRYLEIKNQIIESLQANRPLALLIGPRMIFKEPYKNDFSNHWVLITEYNDESKEITVSSWGEAFVLNLDKLMESKLFISTVTVIEEKINTDFFDDID